MQRNKATIQQSEPGNNITRVTFRCPTKLWDWTKREAHRRRTSIQALCIEALAEYRKLPREGPKGGSA
jgi:hypothetical protein